jgi:hypothetical protein
MVALGPEEIKKGGGGETPAEDVFYLPFAQKEEEDNREGRRANMSGQGKKKCRDAALGSKCHVLYRKIALTSLLRWISTVEQKYNSPKLRYIPKLCSMRLCALRNRLDSVGSSRGTNFAPGVYFYGS